MQISDTVLIAAIASVTSTIATVCGLIVSILNSRKLEAVHQSTNGLLAQSRADAKEIGHAEGVAAEKMSPTP